MYRYWGTRTQLAQFCFQIETIFKLFDRLLDERFVGCKMAKTNIANLKTALSFRRKFSLHQTLYWSSNNRWVWLQVWHHSWYYFGWITQSSTMQLYWYGQDRAIWYGPYHRACCLQYDILRNFCKHIRKISSLEKMRQSVCSEVRFWYRWLCLRYLQATLPEFRFFCEVWFWYCFCNRDFGIIARFAEVKNPQKSQVMYTDADGHENLYQYFNLSRNYKSEQNRQILFYL